ncbi:MAG: methyltransferase domain-containing protein [Bacillota bacterium]
MGAAISVQSLVPYWKRHQVNLVLDYGAGNLRNARFLQELGFKVIVVETPRHLKKIQDKMSRYQLPGIVSQAIPYFCLEADLVLANFVLNIIEREEERKEIISNVYHNLKAGGFFLIDVKEKNQRYPEKGFSEEELDAFLGEWGFNKIFVLRRRGLLGILYGKPS